MNGYFQLDLKPNGTFINIIKETEGGEPVNINELAEYLIKKNINFDVANLNGKILALTGNGSIQLDGIKRYPEREMISVKISEDKMTAVCRFYPPSVGGGLLSKEDIISDLNTAKVTYGVDVNAIVGFIDKRCYCTDYILARGKNVRHGTDAKIEYFFDTDHKAKPAVKEDGSVDFFNLNTLNHIQKGDLLARLIPEDKGEAGIDVMSNVVKPRDVKRYMLKYGRNVSVNENSTEAYSDVSGHVLLVDDKIFVSNVYEVANVDASTGDIDYDGSVKVLGNVNSTYTVRAKGDVEIMGVVEGANVYADGSVIIARGVNGMGKGYIEAKGNIITKYVENATLISGGYIQTEAVMYSKVSAKTEVIVDGRKGNISGSFVSARDLVKVKSLGSQMGTDTVIQLGVDPEMKKRMDVLKDEIEKANKNLSQILPVLGAFKQKLSKGVQLTPEQIKYVKDMSLLANQLSDQREKNNDELDELKDALVGESKSQVIVKDVVYAGTKICINDVQMTLKSDNQYCKFFKDRGDIRSTSL